MNRLDKATVAAFLHAGRFDDLFIGLGWDEPESAEFSLPAREAAAPVPMRRVAQKRGFTVCVFEGGQSMPEKSERRRLARDLRRLHYEHLLIFRGGGEQVWQVEIKPENRPLKAVDVAWRESQDAQLLLEKLDGLVFSFSEEGGLAITDVVDRVRYSFAQNAEKVTRGFYEKFRERLGEFADFIKGVSDRVSREWYASLMLNRLMFIYFLQKKRFLDGDTDYLRNRLERTQAQYGKDAFHDKFYRHFLRALFHKGLGAEQSARSPELRQLIGEAPYLNGGLFDEHAVERANPDLQIPDDAFKRIFEFFDKYNWHLDDRPTASGRDINPDVIGYIFEKYINDRAEMGAYYTQEDVTGYIARNTIIPFLLARAKEKCENAFRAEGGGIWRFLRERPDDYIPNALRKGCEHSDDELPQAIRAGLDDFARRDSWNKKADEKFALPTEIWRETIARRRRYFALKEKMARGEIREIDDLITHNLDIDRFAADALEEYEGADFVQAFYAAVAGVFPDDRNPARKRRRGITILDPACGSGAFLFAALNVLTPLYKKCVDRMRDFIEADDKAMRAGRKGGARFRDFRATLADIKKHPNEQYWILKQVILRNLFGVDFMKEATEIAKLRLFLALASKAEYKPQASENFGLEPLPDIDFNIRAGNSLVGFANMDSLLDYAENAFDFGDKVKQIDEEAKLVDKAHDAFVDAHDEPPAAYRRAKGELQTRLDSLNDKLSDYLADEYGRATDKDSWLESHKPFHWLAEFYGIIENDGGFDVVIGNPPYVKVSKVPYADFSNHTDFSCPDIYGYILDQSTELLNSKGRMGFIVMHNLGHVIKFSSARKMLREDFRAAWFSFYGRIPSGLFSSDVRVRNCVFVTAAKNAEESIGKLYTTRLHRWNAKFRPFLFGGLAYSEFSSDDEIPKLDDSIEAPFYPTVGNPPTIRAWLRKNQAKHHLYVRQSAYNWISVSPEMPPSFRESAPIPQSSVMRIFFENCAERDAALLFLSGRLFFCRWLIFGDDFFVHLANIADFVAPSFARFNAENKLTISRLAAEMKAALPSVIQYKLNAGIKAGTYNTSKLWHITDQSDMILLRQMTSNPDAVFEAIKTHIAQTVKTRNSE